MNWNFGVLKKYAVFKGRARRKEYWMFFLFNGIIGAVLPLIEEIICIAPESDLGGFVKTEASIAPTSKHLVYDPAMDSWSELAPLPSPRHHPHLVAHRDRLFALGGFEAQDMALSSP